MNVRCATLSGAVVLGVVRGFQYGMEIVRFSEKHSGEEPSFAEHAFFTIGVLFSTMAAGALAAHQVALAGWEVGRWVGRLDRSSVLPS